MFNEYTSRRQKMVENQLLSRGIKDPRVIAAMRKVPRHLFSMRPCGQKHTKTIRFPIGEKQTISQPFIVALMTEALKLSGMEKDSEVGTGSGYQAAVLAELAEQVYSIERLPSIAKRARRILDELKYANIVITIGDGTLGWKEHSPYDGIIVTAASPYPPKNTPRTIKNGREAYHPHR